MKKKIDSLKALVVDDYENIRKHLVTALNELGLQTIEAENGVEGLKTLTSETFDIVFTDIVMPEMDGFEFCEEVRKRSEFNNLPIVVVSTHCDSNYIVKALHIGADDYIPKPIDKNTVERVIERVMESLLPEGQNG